MKKVLSILMVIIMMLSIIAVPVYAEEQTDKKQNKHFDKFFDFCFSDNYYYINHYDYYYDHILTRCYDEIYYHYENETDEEPAWTLIYGYKDTDMWIRKYGTAVGNRIIYTVEGDSGSISRHYVYVAELDEFIPLEVSNMDRIIEYCPDFVKTIEEIEYGQMLGDVDENNILDITDVTYIQRFLAGYQDRIGDNFVGYYINIIGDVDVSDFDRDGETAIMDATAIQRQLAGLE